MRTEPAPYDPFRCYLGKKIRLDDRAHVVECYELHGRKLLFRLRQIDTAGERGPEREVRLTVLELLELVEKQKA